MLWVPITLFAAGAQVLRNGAQASLTGRIGTLGATQVRFVFGLPFATAFFLLSLVITGEDMPQVGQVGLLWALLGAVCQIAATGLMLYVMHRRAFGVAYAYIKTEPVIVALMGLILLGDRLSIVSWIAVFVVTAGVLITSVPPQDFRKLASERAMIAAGVVSGGLFGLSAIAFRASIGSVPDGSFVVRSMFILTIALLMQSLILGIWLACRDRGAFLGSLREWRTSMSAGLLGALASAGWFCAFALTPAANVRTLALIEMPMAALLSGKISGGRMARHEVAGLGIVTLGVALLLSATLVKDV